MTTLLIATRNAHKTQEIRQILPGRVSFLTLNDFAGAPAVVEDADTFEGNAVKKALGLAQWLVANPSLLLAHCGRAEGHFFVLADDSGLEVDALNGEPGVHSARFASMDVGASGNSPDTANNAKLLRLLESVPREKRTARFRCVLALSPLVLSTSTGTVQISEPPVTLVEATCEGRISFVPGGWGGFGYDPLFIPEGYRESFAELGQDVKNKLSHRARALEKLRDQLKGI